MTAVLRYPNINTPIEYTQTYGFSTGLRFQALIENVDPQWDVIQQCLDALEAGSIKCGNVVQNQPNLFVQSISIRNVSGNGDFYEADVNCVPLREMEDRWSIEVSTQQDQITSMKDGFGNLLWTGYTYPQDYYDLDLAGQTITQAAPLSRMVANYNFKLKGLKKISDPLNWIYGFQDHVNAKPFLGCGAGVLLCNGSRYYEYGLDKNGNSTYMFEFSFITDWNQHQVEYSFVDNNGQIPADLIYGFGYKHAMFYPGADFNLIVK